MHPLIQIPMDCNPTLNTGFAEVINLTCSRVRMQCGEPK